MVVPMPTLCPDERQKRRLAFRNEKHLYLKCDLSGKSIISNYSIDKVNKVYDQKSGGVINGVQWIMGVILILIVHFRTIF